ncbi:hypothetical protein HF295_01575 [Hujiaoplasma nucleasis]|uniref:Uncharacterized protein n=1 Tax=Hujiaoplasma nucleasis TaxID=2725268 RepID=A0A7L6N044_9MOLU|nr:hypothetical protein [Hujiaoplasma nucleasis]QLY39620.1 hypothetical protein HF295_01575 [Hujiaoplasma nucleasis]
MASKGDILIKYKKAYPEFESQSLNRLQDLKRSFLNEKTNYDNNIKALENQLLQNQNDYLDQMDKEFTDFTQNQTIIEAKFKEIRYEFNQDIHDQMTQLDNKVNEENKLFENIIEQFESRKQDALDIYLNLTKKNNLSIDEDMKVHHIFIEKEQKKLLSFKNSYDELSAQVSNKMIWTIEKSKNAITQLKNDLSKIDKDDLISLNQKILQSLTSLRGTRNDINAAFKQSSQKLNAYKEDIYSISDIKQKPYSEINQKLIQKLIKQIRIANNNKIKYQRIIKEDLLKSQNKLYPFILKAYEEHRSDDLEKYILQVETLENKANYLIDKIEKITNYNISTYQSRIKEIKVEAFTRNEEIKFSYAVPIKYIENAINIYSNYNFYFNQGFNDLDKLLSELIGFSQEFNEIRDDEVLKIKKDLADYQSNFVGLIKKTTDKLSQLLYHIDEIANEIITLESKNRLEIAEIKKEILNVDIKGDYIKFLETLNTDYKLAQKQMKTRLKSINIHKLYVDKTHEIYQSAIRLEEDKASLDMQKDFNHAINNLETRVHRDFYEFYQSKLDLFYSSQTNMLEAFMKIMKERITQSLKARNYYLVKGFFDYESINMSKIKRKEQFLNNLIQKTNRNIELNSNESKEFIDYLSEKAKTYSSLTYFEKNRLTLHQQLDNNYSKKTSLMSQNLIDSYQEKHEKILNFKSQIMKLDLLKKKQLLDLHNNQVQINDMLIKQADFKDVLITLTNIYYDVLKYAYDHHASSLIDRINNYYDDQLYVFTENSIATIDRLTYMKNKDKAFQNLSDYIIYVIDTLNSSLTFFTQVVENIHGQMKDYFIEKIAMVKVHSDEQKEIIDREFDHLEEKTLNLQDKIKKQQELLSHMSEDLNHWLSKNLNDQQEQFKKYANDKEASIEALKTYVLKAVKENDKSLKQLIKKINQEVLYQYQLMMDDYEQEKVFINKSKHKIIFDAEVENQYIDYITEQEIENINTTKAQLVSQANIIPAERQTRLLNLKLNYQNVFQDYQDSLNIKLSKVERDKFVKVPLLEEKIKDVEEKLFEDFRKLYLKHQTLEKEYLNEYIQTNDLFISLHRDYKNDSIKSTLGYDKELDQPLKDLICVEESIIDKTNIIHQEVIQRTKSKMDDIKESNRTSQNKQDRIINS